MKKHLIDPGPSRKGWHRLSKALRCPRLYALSYMTEKRTSDIPPAEPLIKGLPVPRRTSPPLRAPESELYEGYGSVQSGADASTGFSTATARWDIGQRGNGLYPKIQETLSLTYLLHWDPRSNGK